MTIITQYVPELKDLDEWFGHISERVVVAKASVAEQVTRAFADEMFYEPCEGVQVKKLKAYISGVMAVRAAPKKKKLARNLSASPERAEEPARRGGIMGWF